MHELKKRGLIVSKQKPNYHGRNINVLKPKSNKFILIPVNVARDKRLKTGSIILFGLLYTLKKKREKINVDKHLETDTPLIEATKSSLAKDLGEKPEFIRRHLIDLWNHGYLIFKSYNGIGIEIQLNEDADVYIPSKSKKSKSNICANAKSGLSNNLPPKREATYLQSEHPPTSKMSSHLPPKRSTNKVSNRYLIEKKNSFSSSNKDHSQNERLPFIVGKPLTKPIYYEGIPSEDDIPPEDHNIVNESDIAELNKLDSASKCHAEQTSNESAKSGLGEKKAKPVNVSDYFKKDKPRKPIPYQGYNIDFFVNEIRKILYNATNRKYPIAKPAKQAIKLRLDEGYTLDNFKQAINKLVQDGKSKSIDIRQLAIHLKKYA